MPPGNNSCVEPDILSDSLTLLRARGHVGSRTEATSPWGLHLTNADSYFHVIEQGRCWLQLDGAADAVCLNAGDAVILPHGHDHRLFDSPGQATLPIEDVLAEQPDGIVRIGGGGAATAIICGTFRFDCSEGHPLLESLPAVMRVCGEHTQVLGWREMLQRFLVQEIRNPCLGAEAVVARLVELLFVQTIRSWVDELPEGASGWLAALRDPVIRTVLRHMHAEPARSWTVPELASTSCISRSALAGRFHELVGVSPMAYLSRWRLLLAARILRDEGLSNRETAERVGYEAEAAFSRAFKRQFGIAPAAYRKNAMATK